jgi:molecular chaperone GrpE
MTSSDKNEQNKNQAQDLAPETQNNQNLNEQIVAEEPEIMPESSKQEKSEQQEKAEQPDYKDLFLRVNADLQNFQRRVEKQKSEWTVIAQEAIIVKLIPVIEDLDRALGTLVSAAGQAGVASTTKPENATGSEGPDQTAISKWVEGLAVVQKNLKKTLQELGVEIIEPAGNFNPELQEAVAQIDSQAYKAGQIVDTVCKGYKFKNKVIKYAQVVVAK